MQVFSPVVFGLYPSSMVDDKDTKAYANKEIRSTVGHYLSYDYSAISFYMTDYKKGEAPRARRVSVLDNLALLL